MKFALIDGERREPQPGLVGLCPGCDAEVFAKCGEVKVWHWAHKSIRSCDPWWEPETHWHRAWKNLFPEEWQEVPMRASDGELHIADVRAPCGLILEFQHSAIKPEERRSREGFCGNMLWIVDGTRLKRDAPRVDKEIRGWRDTKEGTINLVGDPDWKLPKSWIDCEVPVLFDFGLTRREDFPGNRDGQWPSTVHDEDWWNSLDSVADPMLYLLPKRFRSQAVYFTIQREIVPRIASGEFKQLGWQQAHQLLNLRFPEIPQPQVIQRFTNHRNWPNR